MQWDFPYCPRKKLWPLWKTAGVMATAPASKPHTEAHFWYMYSVSTSRHVRYSCQFCSFQKCNFQASTMVQIIWCQEQRPSLHCLECFVCSAVICTVLCLYLLVRCLHSISVMQICFTFLIPYFMQMLQAQSSVIGPFQSRGPLADMFLSR